MTISPTMQGCIDDCLRCHSLCSATSMRDCLESGGRQVEPDHFGLMLACADICTTAANFMLIGVRHHRRICSVCADICMACAAECERVGTMEDCAAACRTCESSCREMAGNGRV